MVPARSTGAGKFQRIVQVMVRVSKDPDTVILILERGGVGITTARHGPRHQWARRLTMMPAQLIRVRRRVRPTNPSLPPSPTRCIESTQAKAQTAAPSRRRHQGASVGCTIRANVMTTENFRVRDCNQPNRGKLDTLPALAAFHRRGTGGVARRLLTGATAKAASAPPGRQRPEPLRPCRRAGQERRSEAPARLRPATSRAHRPLYPASPPASRYARRCIVGDASVPPLPVNEHACSPHIRIGASLASRHPCLAPCIE